MYNASPIPYLTVSSAILYGLVVEMMCVSQQLCITQELIRNASSGSSRLEFAFTKTLAFKI